jgi:hypothetical protein
VEGIEAQEAWKQEPEFRERTGRVPTHCRSFQRLVHELVAAVG